MTILEGTLPYAIIVVAVVVVVVTSFAAGAGFMFYRRKYMKTKKEAPRKAKDVPLRDITSDQESNIGGTDNEAFSMSEPNSKCYHRFSEIRTVDDVTKYLKENNFGDYAESFKDHDVDGDALKYLDDAILKDLIPKAGPRARFKGILVEMKQENSPVAALNFWEIQRTSLKLGKRLGSGQFGEVRLGELRNRGLTTIVAVKTLRDSASESDKKDLLGELEILVTVGRHDNIISLVGACTKGGPLMIVVEYAPNGCLKDWLKTNSAENSTDLAYQNQPVNTSHLSMEQLIQFGVDVASGMSHLATMQCIHRDLAARNILLGENLVAKVSDFGLSRDIYEDSEYVKSTKSKLPLRWMAYESLFYNVYTTQSDVWSFGVLLWEIMAMGKSLSYQPSSDLPATVIPIHHY
ncbi:fibroblast growth factor receptor 1-like [Branchiostoma floridae x Branchiostoma belcheri]